MPWNDGYRYRQQIGPAAHGKPAADYLAEAFPHSSAEEWIRRIHAGEVELNRRPCDPRTRLQRGAWLVWNRPPWFEPTVDLHHRTVYEDDSLLVVVKPAGLQTLPAGGRLQQTLLHRVRETCPHATPAHRLGRHTSGLLAFGKTPEAIRTLSLAFRESRVERIYRALASGSPRTKRFRVEAPIGPIPYDPLGRLHATTPRGRPAATTVRALACRDSEFDAEIEIHSGRPHQIRIHLAYAGHPLVGDPLYGPGGLPLPGTRARPGDGGYRLHASRLAFAHPRDGRRVEFRSAADGARGGSANG